MSHDANIYSLIVASCFLLTFCILLWMIARIIYFGHSMSSYQGCFTILSSIWTFLRSLFFFSCILSYESWPLVLLRFVFWVPPALEFATFSLLLLFFAQIMFLQDWQQTGAKKFNRALISFWVFNVLFFGFTFVWLGFASDIVQLSYTLTMSRTIVNGTIFALLSILTTICFWKLSRVLRNRQVFPVQLPQGLTAFRLKLLLASILFIFASRCIYDFIVDLAFSADDAFGVANVRLDAFGMFQILFWENLPILLILFVFRRIRGVRKRPVDSEEDETSHLLPDGTSAVTVQDSRRRVHSSGSLDKTGVPSRTISIGSQRDRRSTSSKKKQSTKSEPELDEGDLTFHSHARRFMKQYGNLPGVKASQALGTPKHSSSPKLNNDQLPVISSTGGIVIASQQLSEAHDFIQLSDSDSSDDDHHHSNSHSNYQSMQYSRAPSSDISVVDISS